MFLIEQKIEGGEQVVNLFVEQFRSTFKNNYGYGLDIAVVDELGTSEDLVLI